MNASIRSAIILVSLLVMIAPSSVVSAASGKVTVENLRGPLVNASFSTMDPSGCIETDAFVTANRPTEQQLPGPGTTTGIAGASVFEYDSCTDTVLLQAAGEIDTLQAADFQVGTQFEWASLHTTIPVTNIDTGGVFDLAVNVRWTATSDVYRDHSNTNDRYGAGCHVLNRWKGTGRAAQASGTVSDGLTNFAPAATASAEIGFVIDGFEVIGCP